MFDVDTDNWPLVMVRCPPGAASDAMIDAYLACLEALLESGERYATVTDARPVTSPFTAAQWLRLGRWIDAHHAALDRAQVAHAVVLAEPAVIGVFRATVDLRRFAYPIRPLRTLAAGVDWTLAILVERGLCPERATADLRRRALAGSRAQPLRTPVAEAPAAAFDMKAVIEMFAEPAYVFAPGDGVRYANQAGRRAGVPKALAQGELPEPGDVPFRLLQLDGEPHGLVLVVLEARPVPMLPPLPPALARVAGLLSDGRSDKEIAQFTGLTLATVRTYVSRIFRRVDVNSRAEFAARYGSR